MTVAWRDPRVLLGGVALVVAVRLLGLPPPVRAVVVGAFLLVGPGAALVGPVRWPALLWWTVVLSSSLGLSTLVSTTLLYAGVWTPDRALAVLALGCTGGCAAHLWRGRRREAA